MVKKGPVEIESVHYEPGSSGEGLEVLALAELARRMERSGVTHRTERPDFHLLLKVEQGRLAHNVDFRHYDVDRGGWLWVRPGQVQRFDGPIEAEGVVVLFQQDYLDRATVADTALDDPYGRTLWSIAGDTAEGVDRALLHLSDEFASLPRDSPNRHAILHHLLAVLLLRLVDPHGQIGSPAGDQSDAFTAFRRAVEQEYMRHREVGYYARALGYSPRTLRRASLAASGVGAKQFIDQRVVLEAKRLLAHEDDAVAQVASRLGFDDVSNFVKYFAQRTEHTPAAFRELQRGRLP